MDYSDLIEPVMWQFIQATTRHYPAVGLSIAEQRRAYDAMCRTFAAGRPNHIKVVNSMAGAVRLRHYSAGGGRATIVYFHGGGFIMGGLDSHDDVCAEICAGTGYDVFAVDYRLAPENRHPAMYDDAMIATQHVFDISSQPVLICGDSAGGNLAAAVTHTLRGTVTQITGQLLIYPALGGDPNTGSYLRHADAPMLSRDDVMFYDKIRVLGRPPTGDPTYAPLVDLDFSGLPPTIVITAEFDPLRDDGKNYCKRIVDAGGRSRWINEEGLVHGYLRARHSVPRAKQSFAWITSALHHLGRGVWPSEE